MKVSYAPEALADIVDALTFLGDRSPASADHLDAAITACIERLAAGEFDGPVTQRRSGVSVQSWPVPPFRLYYQRRADELLILRVYHQARLPIAR